MSILVGALEFEGPYSDLDLLSDMPGIYVLLCQEGGEYELLEMGDSDCVREYLQTHPQRDFWHEHGLHIEAAVHYTSDLTPEERREIKETLEHEFDLEAAA